ncbi:putative disease resistance protein RGA3 [Acorus calamus]|uniref:Disease resistance protein RGA3 n=1 Tax=Acorus calamus TaxID=4465 RepID=A0AAV9D929_ACOCL|nr:putative disease resistance protein RGA3 [Acorus calamus]
MAMIVDAFASLFIERLGALVEEEVAMLLGVKDDLKKLERKMERLRSVLGDAQMKELQYRVQRKEHQYKAISHWLMELREFMYDVDDIVDDCRIEAKKCISLENEASTSTAMVSCYMPFISCFHKIAFRHEIGSRIKHINARLEEISRERLELPLIPSIRGVRVPQKTKISRETSSVYLKSDIVGINEDTENLVALLLEGRSERTPVFAIVGMGGIGKTTLAQNVFNNEDIKSHFEIKIWACVSRDFSEIDLLKQIIRSAGGSHGDAQTRAELDPIVRCMVQQKRFFLVLDDVWSGRVWEDCLRVLLQTSADDSRILVTTRNELVARQMNTVYFHHVKLLSTQDGETMLCKMVFGDREVGEIQNLRDIGMKIVDKCSGLPLAIKTIGGVLRMKDASEREWEKVLFSEAWSSTELPNGIMPALYLSYEDLPPHLKQCFVYCSLFPEDHVFLRGLLVQYWIAEGFIEKREDQEMEDLAEDYYRELVKRSLLQAEVYFYDEGGCRMHDLVRDLALFVSQNDYFSVDLQELSTALLKPRRLSLINKELLTIPDIIKKQECLRTLLLFNNPLTEAVPVDLFDKLRRLRVLDLRKTAIQILPESVGSLVHLRLLDLSITRLRELPESLGCLENLQFLLLQFCIHLHVLPKSIVQLHNLRSLDLVGTLIECMPMGIGRLKNLRKFKGFVVGSASHLPQNPYGCSMEELKFLSHLRNLEISNLQRASGGPEAKEAALQTKPNLKHLKLSCMHGLPTQQPLEEEILTIEEIFEELSPPSCLEILEIDGFFGLVYPTWMSIPLQNLLRLDLIYCMFCPRLPPLGQLPQLKCLSIIGASSIVTIGPEFLGSSIGAFPKLQELYIEEMPSWKIWMGWEDGTLPCLRTLVIDRCPNLRSLPESLKYSTALVELGIGGAGSLRTIENISSVKELDIGNNRNLESISNLPKLECLRIGGCPALRYMHNLEELRCIKFYDGEMEALPAWLAGMPQLHRLDISGNANLLRRCFVEDGQDWPKIHCIPQVHGRTLDGSMYLSLSYTKHSLMIHTNIVPTTTTMAVEDVDIDFDAASSASSTIDSYISSY